MYKHTQMGWIVIISLLSGLALVSIIAFSFVGMDQVPYWAKIELGVVDFILLLCVLFFYSLTVIVDDQKVTASFGIGIIKSRIKFTDITSVEIVKNKWWYGWGIRGIPRGWMFNVSGLSAVEIKKTNGKNFRIGTDEPEKLLTAIRAKLIK